MRGNYGSHFQADELSPNQVDLALGCLDNLIAWRFTTKQEKEDLLVRIKDSWKVAILRRAE